MKLSHALLLAAIVGLWGCSKEKVELPTTTHDDHTHAEPAAHSEEDHDHGTEEIDLGSQTVPEGEIQAIQLDHVAAGGENVFKLKFKGFEPKSIRMWVGDENATNSVKALAENHEPHGHHAHVEIPDALTAESKFWVEVETAEGKTSKASFKPAPEPAKP